MSFCCIAPLAPSLVVAGQTIAAPLSAARSRQDSGRRPLVSTARIDAVAGPIPVAVPGAGRDPFVRPHERLKNGPRPSPGTLQIAALFGQLGVDPVAAALLLRALSLLRFPAQAGIHFPTA